MTNVYGSIENEDPNSKDLNLRDEKEHLAPKSLDSNGQGENSNDTSKKSWKLGAAIFICAAVALGRREYITEDTSDMPLFSAVQNLPMTGIERPEEILLIRDHKKPPPAFSTLDPVADLGLFDYDHRPESSSPGTVFGDLHKGQKYTGMPLPTNKWYENMVLVQNGNEPSDQQQVYTVPYVINAIGPVPGIKLHATRLLGMSTIVQVSYIAPHGVTIGAAKSLDEKDLGAQSGDMGVQRRYSVDYEKGEHPEGNVGVMGPLTPLGLTLKWETDSEDSSFSKMTSSIVRGMPYGTIHYHYEMVILEVLFQLSYRKLTFMENLFRILEPRSFVQVAQKMETKLLSRRVLKFTFGRVITVGLSSTPSLFMFAVTSLVDVLRLFFRQPDLPVKRRPKIQTLFSHQDLLS